MKNNGKFHCDFCGKNQDEVEALITGQGEVGICAACIETGRAIVAEARVRTAVRKELDAMRGSAAYLVIPAPGQREPR